MINNQVDLNGNLSGASLLTGSVGTNSTLKGTSSTGIIETDPTIPQYIKNIKEVDIENWNNKSEFSGNYEDLANKPTIPTKVSELANDKGYLTEIPNEYITETELNDKKYLTSYTETDPTVPNHVKAITKDDINKWNSGTGSGTTGTTNYTDLTNKPSINNIELTGNKTLDELNIAKKDDTNKKIDEVESIAKGANQAICFENYESLVEYFNNLETGLYNPGQNVMIITLDVPDLWILGSVENPDEEYYEYEYISDEEIVQRLKEEEIIQIGNYGFAALETHKVDLTEYVKEDNLPVADVDKLGMVQVSSTSGFYVTTGGRFFVAQATQEAMDNRLGQGEIGYGCIVPLNLDYAIKSGITKNKLVWTEEEKTKARELLGVDSYIDDKLGEIENGSY